jgi:transcriptional pleiotropic regulator of transition state genes
MKATGITRQLDRLGRVSLPMSLRRTLGIETGDSMEIFVDGNAVVLQKYQPGCVFCGEAEGVKSWRGKVVCERCMTELVEQASLVK